MMQTSQVNYQSYIVVNESAESSFHYMGRPEEQSDRFPKKMEMEEPPQIKDVLMKDKLKLDFNKLRKIKESKK